MLQSSRRICSRAVLMRGYDRCYHALLRWVTAITVPALNCIFPAVCTLCLSSSSRAASISFIPKALLTSLEESLSTWQIALHDGAVVSEYAGNQLISDKKPRSQAVSSASVVMLMQDAALHALQELGYEGWNGLRSIHRGKGHAIYVCTPVLRQTLHIQHVRIAKLLPILC